MTLSIRGKLFAVSLAVILVVGGICGLYLEYALRDWLIARVGTTLTELAATAREVVREAARGGHAMDDALADRLGAVTGARVTLIGPTGQVLGDSRVASPALDALDDHSHRAEIEAAHVNGAGMARRFSTTLGQEMLYVALKLQEPAAGVLRVAMPLADVELAVARLRIVLAAAALLGLVMAVFLSALAARLSSRAFSAFVEHARALAVQGALPGGQAPDDALVMAVRKISDELARTVSDLAAERHRLTTILHGMTEGVLAVDGDLRITLSNSAAVQMLNLPDAATGALLHKVSTVPELTELFLRKGVARATAEFDANGRRVVAHLTTIGATTGKVAVMHDVTEVRRLEKVRQDFISNVSHELRTPVAVIQANAETLLAGALDDSANARRFVAGVLRNAERLSRLVADLLDLSRIEAGQRSLAEEPIDVREAVAHAVEAVEHLAAAKRISVDVSGVPELWVRADAAAVDQILLNLLDNAVKYTQEDGHVGVSAKPVGRMVRVEVRDDGPGVAPEHRQRVFERFYRVDAGRSRDLGGTGLGLAIVKHLVTAMRGEVGVVAAAPRGAIFWFTLPVASRPEAK